MVKVGDLVTWIAYEDNGEITDAKGMVIKVYSESGHEWRAQANVSILKTGKCQKMPVYRLFRVVHGERNKK